MFLIQTKKNCITYFTLCPGSASAPCIGLLPNLNSPGCLLQHSHYSDTKNTWFITAFVNAAADRQSSNSNKGNYAS